MDQVVYYLRFGSWNLFGIYDFGFGISANEMSGHSHWSTIKRQKGVVDARRGQVFGKLAREIAIAARAGDNLDFNSKLRMIVDKARKINMPKENIKRAIAKGIGNGVGQGLREINLEGYGPAGVAVKVFAISDNKNRTVAEVRSIFQKFGGSLGEQGSAGYIFDEKGNPTFTVSLTDGTTAKKILDLVNALDDHQDVNTVWANFDIKNGLLNC